jgi:hypothetical protein
MANASPTQARSRLTEEHAQPMRAEAIAMRRQVAARGWWLSPLLHDLPIPVLTEHELTADLAKHDRATSAAQKARSNEDQSKATLERIDRPGARERRKWDQPTVADVDLARVKTPATKATLLARKAHSAEITARAKAEGRSPDAIARELAVARISAVAAEIAEREPSAEEREARRKAQLKAAHDKRTAKLKADPELAAKVLAKRREQHAKRVAKRKGTPRPIPNPHRDPTLPTARELREEAIRAAAIERERSPRRK